MGFIGTLLRTRLVRRCAGCLGDAGLAEGTIDLLRNAWIRLARREARLPAAPPIEPRAPTAPGREPIASGDGPADVSVVVVVAGDESEDGARRTLDAWAAALDGLRAQVIPVSRKDDHRIPGLRGGAHLSFVEAANAGARLATGPAIVIAEPGGVADRSWIRPAIQLLRDRPEVGIVGAAFAGGRTGLLPIAVRAELWRSLLGLDPCLLAPGFSIADLRLRARALDYRVLGPTPSHEARPRRLRRRPSRAGVLAAADRFSPGASAVGDFLAAHAFRRRWCASGELDRLARMEARWKEGRPGPPVSKESVSKESIVIYTAICQGYDAVKTVPAGLGVDCVAFLDESTEGRHAGKPHGWQVRRFDPVDADPKRSVGLYKTLPHRFFPDKQYSLWIDGSVSIVAPFPVEKLIALYLGERDLCVFRQPRLDCIYDEAREMKRLRWESSSTVDAQMRRYRREGFPRHQGLNELTVVLRRHTAAVRELDEAWWREICAGSRRDQLSFNYVAWKQGFKYETFFVDVFGPNGLFVVNPHAAPRPRFL